MHSTKSGGVKEELHEFWNVKGIKSPTLLSPHPGIINTSQDKFDYVNMGFSRAVNPEEGSRAYKYLTCADCEIPIVGLQYLDEEPSFVSTQRVNYQ